MVCSGKDRQHRIFQQAENRRPERIRVLRGMDIPNGLPVLNIRVELIGQFFCKGKQAPCPMPDVTDGFAIPMTVTSMALPSMDSKVSTSPTAGV